MPPGTEDAAAHHGRARGATARENPEQTLAALAGLGISMKQITDELRSASIAQFADATDELLHGIEKWCDSQTT